MKKLSLTLIALTVIVFGIIIFPSIDRTLENSLTELNQLEESIPVENRVEREQVRRTYSVYRRELQSEANKTMVTLTIAFVSTVGLLLVPLFKDLERF